MIFLAKKKVLVIGTGGTIASVKTKDGLKPVYKTEDLISFFPEVTKIADIEGKMLFNMDSTNMQPHHWSEIAKEIESQYYKYDGFVITHGTDTIHYTSSALSFMLKNLSKPVVLTGSIKAVGKNSDAGQNFTDAVIVAVSGINEVCVVFHGKIIKGCKARKITNEATKITNEHLDVYSSINFHLIGELVGTLKDNKTRKIFFGSKYDSYKIKKRKKLAVLPEIDTQSVFFFKIYPGLNPSFFGNLTKYRSILIEAFGPGNIPSGENSLIEQINTLTKKNILVFITTQNPFGEIDMTLYEVGQKAIKAGAIPCKDMTTETALVKLMWLYGNFAHNPKTIKKLMMKSFAGEIRT